MLYYFSKFCDVIQSTFCQDPIPLSKLFTNLAKGGLIIFFQMEFVKINQSTSDKQLKIKTIKLRGFYYWYFWFFIYNLHFTTLDSMALVCSPIHVNTIQMRPRTTSAKDGLILGTVHQVAKVSIVPVTCGGISLDHLFKSVNHEG